MNFTEVFQIFEDIPVNEEEYLLLPFDFFIYRGFVFSAKPLFICENSYDLDFDISINLEQ